MKYAILLIILLPGFTKGQSILAKKYVDDRINELTYLKFTTNNTFEYHYLYDLSSDFATGHYKLKLDTIFLKYDNDITISKVEKAFSSSAGQLRKDTLILKGYKLYEVKNGISLEYAKPLSAHHKVPKSWHWKRKYILFGPYQSTRSNRYYMIDSSYAGWNILRN